MRSRVLIVLLGLVITLALLIFTVPDSLAQDAEVGVTAETSLRIDDVLVGGDILNDPVLTYPLTLVNGILVPDLSISLVGAKEIDILGSGFDEGAKVEFRRLLEDGTTYTITPSSEKITFVDSTLIRVKLPASVWVNEEGDLQTGLWDVWLTNPNGSHDSYKEAITVEVKPIDDKPMPPEVFDPENQLGPDFDPNLRDVGNEQNFGIQCIIATAAYGSEMAPEVQFLREFRDQTVLSTFAGSSFMDAFNSFYYSWSPGVADSIREDDQAKAFTRDLIVPLLGVLAVSSSVYVLLSSSPELGVTLAGFVASSMLGAIYLTLPMIALLGLVSRLMSKSIRGFIIRKGIILLLALSATGFAITALGVYASSSSLTTLGSATLVLSSMFVAALIVSSLILVVAGPTYPRINSMWHVITDPIRARRQ